MLKRMKTRTLWIIFAIAVVISVALVAVTPFIPNNYTKVFIVLIAVSFLFVTFWLQYATSRTVTFKRKLKNYPHKEYEGPETLRNLLNDSHFTLRKAPYGESYLKIDGKRAFKVVLVTDNERYFNQTEEDSKGPANKALDKCETFLGVEIFTDVAEEKKVSLTDFTLQGEKIYYMALNHSGGKYICYNYDEPKEKHKKNMEDLFSMLNLKEKKDEKSA